MPPRRQHSLVLLASGATTSFRMRLPRCHDRRMHRSAETRSLASHVSGQGGSISPRGTERLNRMPQPDLPIGRQVPITILRSTHRPGSLYGAPGRTRTCATGSGGPFGLSAWSSTTSPVLLNRASDLPRPDMSTRSSRFDCQIGLPKRRAEQLRPIRNRRPEDRDVSHSGLHQSCFNSRANSAIRIRTREEADLLEGHRRVFVS